MVAGGAVSLRPIFALYREVNDAGWDFNRMVQAPIEAALKARSLPASVTGELYDAILSDDTGVSR